MEIKITHYNYFKSTAIEAVNLTKFCHKKGTLFNFVSEYMCTPLQVTLYFTTERPMWKQ